MSSPTSAPVGGEIDLIAVLQRLWIKRWFIAAFLATGLVLGVIYLKEETPTYTAVLRVTQAASSANGAQSRLRGLSNLVAAAGLTGLPSEGATPFDLYLDSLQSQDLAAELANDPLIMRKAFAAEWDAAAGRWREPPGRMRQIANTIKPLLGFPRSIWRKPSASRLQDYLSSSVIVTKDDETPITQITFDHRDPKFAVYLLKRLNAVADERIRRRALDQATRYAKYLSARMATTPLAEHRQVLASTLSEQERSIMMASSAVAYAAAVVEPPYASDQPTKPKPGLALLASTLGIGLIGVFFALLDFSSIIRAVTLRNQRGESQLTGAAG